MRNYHNMRLKKFIWVLLPIAILVMATILVYDRLSNAGNSEHSAPPASHLAESKIKGNRESVEKPLIIAEKPQNTVNPKTETLQTIAVPPVSAEKLFAHIKALAKERYTDSDRDRARNYILQVLQTSGWSPTLQPFEGGVNVLAKRPGTDSQAGTILLAAHYDSVPGSPGADDNASGIATVLEIARLLGKRPTPRTLQIAFFDLEERGLLGSFAFTNNAANLVNLQGAIVLDMVGFACHTVGCQKYPQGLSITPPSDKGDFLAIAGDTEHIPLLNSFFSNQINLPTLLKLPIPFKGLMMPDILRSDHAPFWYKGIGAVFITDTANFRNPHYHQPSDKFETLDRKFILGAASIVANATATLLESRVSLATKLEPLE